MNEPEFFCKWNGKKYSQNQPTKKNQPLKWEQTWKKLKLFSSSNVIQFTFCEPKEETKRNENKGKTKITIAFTMHQTWFKTTEAKR